MPQEKPETIWLRTEFAFPTGDRCQCHKHRARNGKTKRCPNRDSVIGLKHPKRQGEDLRTFCLDCWATCRTEKTIPNPAQTRMYERMRRQGMTLAGMGC